MSESRQALENRRKLLREAAHRRWGKGPASSRRSSEEAKDLGRRAFLKLFLLSFLVLGAGGLLKAIKELAPPDTPEYFELGNGKKISLFKGGTYKTVVLTMSYLGDVSSLKVRLTRNSKNPEKREPLFVKFSPGAKNRRHTGEIIEPRVYKLEIDRDKIGKGYTVGLYPNPDPHVDLEGRIDCPETDGLWGIPVITAPENLLPGLGEQPPFEKNAGNVSETWMNIREFGRGYLIGRMIDSGIEGEKTFKAIGYVNDARVFKVIKEPVLSDF